MSTKDFFRPVSAQELPRFAGVPTFMRLPHLTLDDPRIDAVDVGLIGVPWDSGTTNRPGTRHGPRQLRDYSTMIRGMNPVTNVWPFELMNCATFGITQRPMPLPSHTPPGSASTWQKGVQPP